MIAALLFFSPFALGIYHGYRAAMRERLNNQRESSRVTTCSGADCNELIDGLHGYCEWCSQFEGLMKDMDDFIYQETCDQLESEES